MTAKRFTYVLGGGFAVNGAYISPHKVVELLNELHEEREYWKQQAETRFKRIRELEEMIE